MIFGWLKHRRLVRKGLACDKTRLRLGSKIELLRLCAETNWIVRLLILLFFTSCVYLLVGWRGPLPLSSTGNSLATGFQAYSGREQQLLAFLVFVTGLMLLELDASKIWQSNSRLFLVVGVTVLNVLLSRAFFLYWPFRMDDAWQVYFISPCTFAPFLLTLLLGPRVGLYSVVQVSLLGALIDGHDFTYMLFSLLSGFTAVYFSQSIRKRVDLIRAGVAVGAINFLCALALGIVAGRAWSDLCWLAVYGIGSGMITAMVVSAILPLIETLFELTTEMSWIEQADLNHPLLQQMTIEAPGTYHHSLVVANLVEAGAKAIGLNGTSCRVMAYFHDIGKLIKPGYYSENIPPGANPHENLSPNMSALILVSHVKEGVDLALKHHLNKPILDSIQQHHGDSVVRYFYNRAVQQQEDAREGGKIMNMREGDVPEVDENSFRYPGPKPQSKEVALLAIADTIEAASRSLEKPTAQRIDDLVEQLVEQKVAEHLLDESPLTLNELWTAAQAMANTVKTMMHTRIAYGKKDKTSESSVIQSTKRGAGTPSSTSAAA